VYAKKPFTGPQAVLEYLSRYTHRVAISNRRIIHYDTNTVTFKWKDYRAKDDQRFKTMTLSADEFLRRFLIHILPLRFHRIRHFGLFANHQRKQNLLTLRKALYPDALQIDTKKESEESSTKSNNLIPKFICRTCGTSMVIIETLLHMYPTRGPP